MNKFILVILLAIAGLAVFCLGYLISGLSGNILVSDKEVSVMNSKLIAPVYAYGQVKSIMGRLVTIQGEGETLEVSIREDAEILDSKGDTKQLRDIRINSYLDLNLKVSDVGAIEAAKVIIIPPPSR